jgi:steroid delta-isomerase-like uncharacterized protein
VPAKEIKALVRRFFEEYNKGKTATMAVIDELCAANFVWHPSTGEEIRGLEDFKQNTNEVYSAFPDLHFAIDDMVVEGERVVVRWTFTGTHKGEFMGIPPTNKKITAWGIEIYRVVDGKFVESWERFDDLGLMQQLGLIPKQGQD